MPTTFFQAKGLLYILDGMTPWLRWDGFTAQAEAAGVAAPTAAPTLAASGTGDITGTYRAYVRFVDKLGNYSDPSPVSDDVAADAADTITYTGVAVAQQPSVVRKQILRNTAGQATTYYVDVDTDDIGNDTFTSTLTDDFLQVQIAVPLFDTFGKDLLRLYAEPPATKAFAAYHLDRAFAAGELTYSEGSALVTNGSKTVTGIGTEWQDAFAGRRLYVVGAPDGYEIDSCDRLTQTITLVEPYLGPTDQYAAYAVRPAPATANTVRYTEAGAPDGWPEANGFDVPEDGDEITGLLVMGAFLFVLKRRHIYRFTHQTDPARDGGVFLASRRGCVNNRAFCQVGDVAYLLDETGVHAFDGGDSNAVSSPISRVFGGDHPLYKINWGASQFFHASYYPRQEQIRFFVCMAGDYLPRHAVTYSLATQRWWVEEYARPIAASCLGLLGTPTSGWRKTNDAIFLGSTARGILAFDTNPLDGPDRTGGTTRGTATSASRLSLTDAGVNFAAAGLVGNPVAIVAGRGKGQTRRVAAATATTLTVTSPWVVRPDATSEYQVGGIDYRYRTRWYRLTESETRASRRVEVLVGTPPQEAYLNVRVGYDYAAGPVEWASTVKAEDNNGVAVAEGLPDIVCDLSHPRGFFEQRIDGHKDRYADRPRMVRVEILGTTGAGGLKIDRIGVDGVNP